MKSDVRFGWQTMRPVNRLVLKVLRVVLSTSSLVLALLGLGSAGDTSVVMAQERGTFTRTGSMTTARDGHTAALLTNGKVLIVGGSGDASAELYDPSTGTFAATGSMTTARPACTATLLADGRVLITGGDGPGGVALTSAELYDPSTGLFTATGEMNSAGGRATLLGNGKVLITGVPNAEIYDPATETFAATGAYAGTDAIYPGSATLLADGRVLITGDRKVGRFFEPGPTEIYDPGTGTFSLSIDSVGTLDWYTATLLTNGEVLIAGGEDCSAPFASAGLYDPSNQKATGTGNMTTGRELHTATLLPDLTVLISGSQLAGGDSLATAELYDPATGTFSATGKMTTPRFGHTATLLPDGTVLTAGGASPTFRSAASSAELYHPAVLVSAPVLFSLSGDGRGQGAILHSGTHQVVSSSDPAIFGEALEIYGTGLINRSVIPPQVAIGGRVAEVLFFGNAPGYPSLDQVNIRVPSGVAPGPAVPVRLTYLGRPSNAVTIGAR